MAKNTKLSFLTVQGGHPLKFKILKIIYICVCVRERERERERECIANPLLWLAAPAKEKTLMCNKSLSVTRI